ncbi:MAG TPA: hypothetical protein DCP31_22075 [Cyanobacteria bacterium UBA8543]|nr:hypothetical protein [Cyanobacteria bacterium UBA8543]
MKQAICSTLTAVLALLIAEISLPKSVTAKLLVQVPATKQVGGCTGRTCTSYRINYERAIAKGVIERPSWVADEEQAIQLGYQAIEKGDRYEAAIRFAQALVLISENYDLKTALEFEQNLDTTLQQEKGQTLREFLPTFERIFSLSVSPPQTDTPYRINYERAIANGLINRPSPVVDEQEATELAYQAIEKGDRYESAIRFAQALVIISETDGTTNALDFERRLDAYFLEQENQTLREFLPLFERILPLSGNLYR